MAAPPRQRLAAGSPAVISLALHEDHVDPLQTDLGSLPLAATTPALVQAAAELVRRKSDLVGERVQG